MSDSELLVRQITGEYQVKSPKLADLFREAQLLLLRIGCWNIQHVKRELNSRADELANLAMDRGKDVVVYDRDEPEAVTSADPGSCTASATPSPESKPAHSAEGSARVVRVNVAAAPNAEVCQARPLLGQPFDVEHTLPAGVCVHAAHALLPTIIAIQSTEAAEFAAVPTLTVRCSRAGCNATFQVAPTRSQNGKHA